MSNIKEGVELPEIPSGEGWLICYYEDPKKLGESFNQYQVQADLDGEDEEDCPFDTDEEAIVFLVDKAREGSEHHIKILNFLEKNCPDEREFIRKETGF